MKMIKNLTILLVSFFIMVSYYPPSMIINAEVVSTSEEFFDFDQSKKTIIGYSQRIDAPKNLVIPDTINGISVEKIGENAFAGHQLTSVVIPGSVKEIGNRGFADNKSLTKVTLNEGLITMGDNQFKDSSITTIHIPSSVKKMGAFTFANTPLKTVSFEHNSQLASIDDCAFAYAKLETITIPATVKKIGENAFSDTSLKTVIFEKDSQLETIGANAFNSTPLKTVTFEKDSQLETIRFNAFSSTELESIKIPSLVKTIDNSAFSSTPLKTVTFENDSQLETIGDSAFRSTQLEKIDIPSLVKTIGNSAFGETNKLKEIHIATKLRGEIKGEPWDNKMGVVYWKDVLKVEPYIYDLTNKKIIKYIGTEAKTKLDIPNELVKDGVKYPVEKIAKYAFYNADISAINIPNSVVDIDSGAFEGTKNPIDVTFSANSKLNKISEFSFTKANLKSISLPNTIESIDDCAFAYAKLETITIPATVKKIGYYAFSSTPLKTVTFEKDSQLETIDSNAFSSSKLESIKIPSLVKTIGNSAFSSTPLKTVTFEKDSQLETIGDSAFSSTQLEKIDIPKTIKSFANNVFVETPNLKTIFIRQSRQKFIASASQPWGALTTAKVYYEGEYIDFINTVDKVANEYKRNINIKAFITDNDLAIIQKIELPNGQSIAIGDKKWPSDLGNYVYQVDKNDDFIFRGYHSSGSVIDYTVTIDDIGVPIINAVDAKLYVSKLATLQKDDILKLIKASATDEIKADLTKHIILNDEYFNAVKALKKIGDFTNVTLNIVHPYSQKETKKTVRITVIGDLEHIIPDPTPETDDDKPKDDEYVTVRFKKGEHGSLKGVEKYYVLKNGNHKINELKKPKIQAEKNWHVGQPNWQDANGQGLDDNTLINKDLVYTAQYLKDIIPDPTPETDDDKPKDDEYVTVRFKKGEHGSLKGIDKYYVLKSGNHKINELKKPTIQAEKNWHVGQPNWQDANGQGLDDNTLINKDLVYTAQYLKDIIPDPTNTNNHVLPPRQNVPDNTRHHIIPNTIDKSNMQLQYLLFTVSVIGILALIICQRKVKY